MVSRRNGQSTKWSVGEIVFDVTSRIRFEYESSGINWSMSGTQFGPNDISNAYTFVFVFS